MVTEVDELRVATAASIRDICRLRRVCSVTKAVFTPDIKRKNVAFLYASRVGVKLASVSCQCQGAAFSLSACLLSAAGEICLSL